MSEVVVVGGKCDLLQSLLLLLEEEGALRSGR